MQEEKWNDSVQTALGPLKVHMHFTSSNHFWKYQNIKTQFKMLTYIAILPMCSQSLYHSLKVWYYTIDLAKLGDSISFQSLGSSLKPNKLYI